MSGDVADRAAMAVVKVLRTGEVICRRGYDYAPRLSVMAVDVDGVRIGVCRWSSAYQRPEGARIFRLDMVGPVESPDPDYEYRFAACALRGEPHAPRSGIVGWTDTPERWAGHEEEAFRVARAHAAALARGDSYARWRQHGG